jgi:hypothetical protein
VGKFARILLVTSWFVGKHWQPAETRPVQSATWHMKYHFPLGRLFGTVQGPDNEYSGMPHI